MNKTEHPIRPRLRMAPSPTGFFHLGNFRTALFGYLLARRWKGDFILRIEDTDRERFVEGAQESLLRLLDTMKMTIDEGPTQGGEYGPYVQSERLDMYRRHAEDLIEAGEAYYCFSTPEELEAMRARQTEAKLPPRYDRTYRDYPLADAKKRIAAGERYVIRHKLPLEGEVIVHDELRGDITFRAADLEDYVLLKSDGFPTYQLASVVDDHAMEITHVTRGEEWLPSFPKNSLLYKSFGWEAPKFIHLPLILSKGGGKLSKRQGDVFVEDYLAKGYLPEALINFCVLLGWHPKDEQEIFSLKELEETFDIDGIGTSPAVFDDEKLNSLNGHYIRSLSPDALLERARSFLPNDQPDDFLKAILALEQPRLKALSALKESTAFFFEKQLEYDPSLLVWKKSTPAATKNNLGELLDLLEELPETGWKLPELEESVIGRLRAEEKPLGDYLWPMRVALSGRTASPGPFEIASVLGKEVTLAKIRDASSRL